MVEFGCQNGRTARLMLDNLPLQRYLGIDVPKGYVPEKSVQRNEVPDRPGEYAMSDYHFRLMLAGHGSFNLSPKDIGTVDVAFIDGDHSRAGVLQDWYLAKNCIRLNGMIIFHDYHNLGTVDVAEALHEIHKDFPLRHVEGTWIAFAYDGDL